MNNMDYLNCFMERTYKYCKNGTTRDARIVFLHQAFGAVQFACEIDPKHDEFYTQFWMDEENGWRKKFEDLVWEV